MFLRKVFDHVDPENKAVLERLFSVYRGWYTTKAVQRARDGSAMRSLRWHNDPFVPDHDGCQGTQYVRIYISSRC